jgi:hypothetical protein
LDSINSFISFQFLIFAALAVVALASDKPYYPKAPYYPKPAYPSYSPPEYPKPAYPSYSAPEYPKPAYPSYSAPEYPKPAYPAPYAKSYDYVSEIERMPILLFSNKIR